MSIDLPSDDLRLYPGQAYDASFARELSGILQELGWPRLDWVLTDYAAYWAPAVASRHGADFF